METKELEEIIKEFEEQTKAIEETNDLLSLLLDGVANSENDFNEFAEEIMSNTYDNFNESSIWLAIASAIIAFVAPEVTPWWLTAEALGASGLAAAVDYSNDHKNLGSQIPEYVQDIYDYAAAYNEKVKAAEKNFNEADEKSNKLKKNWDKIKNLVDKNNGKLNDSANEDEFLEIIADLNKIVPDANIVLEGNQIKNYDEVDKLIYKKIDKASINEKRSYLKESYDKVLLYKDIIDEKYQSALDKRNNAYEDRQKALTQYNMALADLNESASPEKFDTFYNSLVEAINARKKLEKANLEFDAISRLYTSYEEVYEMDKNLSAEESELNKAIEQAEKKLNNPDYGKDPKQLDWETYAERERERNMPGAGIKTNQMFPTTITAPAETPYSNNQTIPNTTQNNILTPEMAETINSMPNAIIAEAAAIPEMMREIGMQSLTAFTDGLLINKEYLAEAMDGLMNGALNACEEIISSGMDDIVSDAVSSLDFHSIGYEKGSEFMDGFNASISENDMNDIFNQLMAERSLAVSGMTAGQQMASFNYYGSAPQRGSKPETIELKNHEDIKLVVDGDVLAKTVREANRKFQRGTGT